MSRWQPPRAGGVASPCISLCRMSAASGCCEGCGRTLDEIARWGSADDAERLDILAQIAARRQAAAAAPDPSPRPDRQGPARAGSD